MTPGTVPAVKPPGKAVVSQTHKPLQQRQPCQFREPALARRLRPEIGKGVRAHMKPPVRPCDMQALPYLFERRVNFRYCLGMRMHIDPFDVRDATCLHPAALIPDPGVANGTCAIVVDFARHFQKPVSSTTANTVIRSDRPRPGPWCSSCPHCPMRWYWRNSAPRHNSRPYRQPGCAGHSGRR